MRRRWGVYVLVENDYPVLVSKHFTRIGANWQLTVCYEDNLYDFDVEYEVRRLP